MEGGEFTWSSSNQKKENLQTASSTGSGKLLQILLKKPRIEGSTKQKLKKEKKKGKGELTETHLNANETKLVKFETLLYPKSHSLSIYFSHHRELITNAASG